jgi:chitinase
MLSKQVLRLRNFFVAEYARYQKDKHLSCANFKTIPAAGNYCSIPQNKSHMMTNSSAQRNITPGIFRTTSIAGMIVLSFVLSCHGQIKKENKVVIGYVGGYDGAINAGVIDAGKLTHINYAFVDIKNNRAWLHNEATDTSNFRRLNELKKSNPDLKILISIGGWSWSEHFSDAVLTDSSRKQFSASAIAIVQKYNLDGVDIDWEFPGMQGEDNVYRPEDKEHFTQIFAVLREDLDHLQKQTHKKYFLTAAMGAFQAFLDHTEMDKVQNYLDYLNLMTYDFKTEADTIAGHHTNLYNSTTDPEEYSADRSIREYLAAGVPAEKIVMGIAFYGHCWKVVPNNQNGLNCKVITAPDGFGYTTIKDSLINQHGYKRYWDEKAKAPYLYNSDENLFISYDDEESVRHKCQYVKDHELGGVMFWEYFADEKGYLLFEINRDLK